MNESNWELFILDKNTSCHLIGCKELKKLDKYNYKRKMNGIPKPLTRQSINQSNQ